MKKLRLRALVLAAGHGKRLRPLTSFIPKPLVPIRGKPVSEFTLDQLAAIGCDAVALNLFHHGESIREQFGSSHRGLPVHYSEEPELLGTLGALKPLRGFFDQADLVLVINGDSLCRWPLKRALRRHLRRRADATLLVSRRADPARFGGGVGVMRRRSIVSLRPSGGSGHGDGIRRRVFMGVHVLSPALLDGLPEGPADFVSDLYEPLLASGGNIAAFETSRRWHDLGTPERYRRAVLSWGPRRGWIAGGVRVAEGTKVERSVIESGVRVEEDSTVVESVVLPSARIGRGCRIVQSVVGPEVQLPAHTAVERRLVTAVRADATPPETASMLGGLVYEPI